MDHILHGFRAYYTTFMLVVALLGTVFFATYRLSESPAVWYDEGYHTQASMYIATHGTQALQLAPDTFTSTQYISSGFPLLYPVALSYHLFGVGVLQGRGVMVVYIFLFSVASYFFVRRLFGGTIAAWAALLLASFPMLYGNGKTVLGELPGLFFLVLTFLSLEYLERSGYRSTKGYILFGLSAGLCIASKPIFLLLLGALFVAYVLRIKKVHLHLSGIVWGSVVFLAPLALWAYLQFSPSLSLHTVLSFYSNPYSIVDLKQLILSNIVRFFTESTPIYTLLLMVVWAFALWIRRKKEQVSAAESAAFIFCILVLLAFLRLPGWYRYLFEAVIVALLFLPSSARTVSSYIQEKLHSKIPYITRAGIVPYIGVALLVCAQFYQTAADSYVAGYYSSHTTAELSATLGSLGSTSSFFLYNVPQVAVFLPSRQYYQYLYGNNLEIGKEQLDELKKGTATYVIVDTEAYTKQPELFTRYRPYKTVERYAILERTP